MMLDLDLFKPLLNNISLLTNLQLDICRQGEIVYSSNSASRSRDLTERIRRLSLPKVAPDALEKDEKQEHDDLFAVPLKIQKKPAGFLVASSPQEQSMTPRLAAGSGSARFSDLAKSALTNLAAIIEESWAAQKESEEMTEQLTQHFEALHLYARITPQITTLKFSKKMFNELIEEFLHSMRVEMVFSRLPQKPDLDVLLIQQARSSYIPDPTAFIDKLIKAIPAEAASIKEHYFIVNDSYNEPAYRALHKLPFRFLAVTIEHNEQFYGWLGLVSFNLAEIFHRSDLRLMISIAEQISVVIRNMELYDELNQFVIDVVKSLIYAIEAKDVYTRGHSERVSHFSMLMAEKMNLSREEKENLRWASILHDIGKIGIPEEILNKTGRLVKDEYNIIRMHPQKGFSILKPLQPMLKALPGILYHHEHFDGRGYPEQLKGKEIPLIARIIAVADTYDAINSDRAYRLGRPPQETLEIIQGLAGTQLDAEIVKIFADVLQTDCAGTGRHAYS